MRQVELTIEKLANGGAGFGRDQGKAFFVPFTAPGDVATVRVTREKSSYAEADLVALHTPSDLRVTPPCPIFGECGGCNWQHLGYQSQLDAKRQIFAELLWRSARIEPEIIPEVLPAPEPFGYRSRIQLKVSHQQGEMTVGFYRPKTHRTVSIPNYCAIAHKRLNGLLDNLRRLLKQCPFSEGITQVDLARGDDDCTTAVFHCSGSIVNGLTKYLQVQRPSLIDSVFIKHGRVVDKIYGVEQLSYKVRCKYSANVSAQTLYFSKDAFSQINYDQNQQLLDLVAGYAALTGCEHVLDLYCGNGNFSIPLADSAAEIVGFEDNASSVGDARANAAHNGHANVSYHCSDSLQAVQRLSAEGTRFHVVILDPPRDGAADVVRHIPALGPDKIIYVSCDPATLARDLNQLQQNGYKVKISQGVDMFPQTYHLESVTLLTKS